MIPKYKWRVAKLEVAPFRAAIEYDNGLFMLSPQEYKGPWIVAPHYHRDLEIIHSIDLEGEAVVDGRSYPMHPGTVLAIPLNSIHAFKYLSGQEGHMFVLQISTDTVISLLKKHFAESETDFENAILNIAVSHPGRSQKIAEFIGMITPETVKVNSIFEAIKNIGTILSILERLLAEELPKTGEVQRKFDPRVRRIIDVVQEVAFDPETSLDSIAIRASISKHHLCRIFQRGTGLTIHDQISTLRLKKACTELANGKNVTEVCGSCGFGGVSHFIQFFKNAMGRTPKQWALEARRSTCE